MRRVVTSYTSGIIVSYMHDSLPHDLIFLHTSPFSIFTDLQYE